MKFTRTQYKKLEELMPMAERPASVSNYKL